MQAWKKGELRMKVGDFVIHWADCPSDKMIARITKFKKELWHGEYVNDSECCPRKKRTKWRNG